MDSRSAPAHGAKWGAIASAIASAATLSFVSQGVARADSPSPADQALATTLFREGRRLMEAGQIEQACEKLAESQRLEPGGGTLLNLAACHEKQGRTASAWTEFNAALAQARRDARDDRARAASERIASIEARLSTLTIRVTPPSADVTVSLDQTPVRSPAWGIAVPVDPGEHVIEATAPHKRPWRVKVVVGAEHDAQTAQVPLLDAETTVGSGLPPAPTTTAPISKSTENGSANATTPASDTSAASSRSTSHAGRDGLTIAAGLIGVAGVTVGTIFGIRAISKHEASNDACPSGLCTRDGAALNDSAHSAGNVSTVAFAIGAAGIGAAAVLFFTRPSSSASARARTSLPIAGASKDGAFIGWSARF